MAELKSFSEVFSLSHNTEIVYSQAVDVENKSHKGAKRGVKIKAIHELFIRKAVNNVARCRVMKLCRDIVYVCI